eukprot:jgi/Botrbrau1/12406/Bobra.0229s0004.1
MYVIGTCPCHRLEHLPACNENMANLISNVLLVHVAVCHNATHHMAIMNRALLTVTPVFIVNACPDTYKIRNTGVLNSAYIRIDNIAWAALPPEDKPGIYKVTNAHLWIPKATIDIFDTTNYGDAVCMASFACLGPFHSFLLVLFQQPLHALLPAPDVPPQTTYNLPHTTPLSNTQTSPEVKCPS